MKKNKPAVSVKNSSGLHPKVVKDKCETLKSVCNDKGLQQADWMNRIAQTDYKRGSYFNLMNGYHLPKWENHFVPKADVNYILMFNKK